MDKDLIIIGNWKMYKSSSEAVEFIKQLTPLVKDSKATIGLAVPFTAIESCSKAAKGTSIDIGAQNINDAREGAFTGEIAASMVKNAGATFVIVGHSERREYFNEDNTFIHAKVLRALSEGLKVILCIGETSEQREKNHEEILHTQLQEGLKEVPAEKVDQIMIAYEPVWAIGTGQSATPEIAQETHAFCRSLLTEIFSDKGNTVPILYGGSVKPENAKSLLEKPDINGALVGGASLEVKSFSAIIHSHKE